MDFKKFKYNSVYSTSQESLIKSEFKRSQGQCYLDHAGATLYSESQIHNITKDLTTILYANPHSQSSSSKTTKDSVDVIRLQCLNHFKANPEEYSLIFTSGATGALRLVSETFDYQNGTFCYLEDNHTSVLGMREHTPNINVVTVAEAQKIFSRPQTDIWDSTGNSLFVYPAQCNFAGTKYPLSWIEKVHNGALNNVHPSKNWFCLLDAAAFVSTNELDLSKYKPDFVCVSFYKIFGYPTGLGALLVRNDRSDVLVKRYYGGGTVFMTIATENVVKRKLVLHERFEDGTLNYLSILSLKHGFDTFRRLKLNMDLISKHTFGLAQYIYATLCSLHHFNRAPVAILYHDTDFVNQYSQGAIINFNLLRSNGEYIGYSEVSHIANLFGIHLRTGCFCNPGACQRHLKLSSKDVFEQFQKGHVCGDQNDLIDGVPTGSVRISIGYMTTKEEADEFLTMIENCFVAKPIVRITQKSHFGNKSTNQKQIKNHVISEKGGVTKIQQKENPKEFIPTLEIYGKLESIFLYPIKSCGLLQVKDSWELIKTGLKYDREWMITNSTGVCMTQKNNTNLCKIVPEICIENNTLQISYHGQYSDKLPLTMHKQDLVEVYRCQSKVCNDSIVAWDCGEMISSWLHRNLNVSGTKLMRQCLDTSRVTSKLQKGGSGQLSLTNQAQFLLINRKSVEWLLGRIDSEFSDTVDDLIIRFRPNFVVNFEEPFVENDIKEFHINNLIFRNVGNCTRCQMICINQVTGEKTIEPLRTLSKELKGKISFGVYLKYDFCDKNSNILFVHSDVVGYC